MTISSVEPIKTRLFIIASKELRVSYATNYTFLRDECALKLRAILFFFDDLWAYFFNATAHVISWCCLTQSNFSGSPSPPLVTRNRKRTRIPDFVEDFFDTDNYS